MSQLSCKSRKKVGKFKPIFQIGTLHLLQRDESRTSGYISIASYDFVPWVSNFTNLHPFLAYNFDLLSILNLNIEH